MRTLRSSPWRLAAAVGLLAASALAPAQQEATSPPLAAASAPAVGDAAGASSAPGVAPAAVAASGPAAAASDAAAAPRALPAAGASLRGAPIFVLNSLDATVSVIDPLTFVETARIPTGKEPHHLYLTPDEKSLIVANAASDSLTFIDPRTAQVQRVVNGIVDPYHLRFSPDMKWFVTLANRLNHVDIYRWWPEHPSAPLQLVKRIPTGKTPSHQWIDGKSQVVYASMQDSDEIIAIDLATQTIRWRVSTGSMPADVYLSADDRTLLVGLTGDRFVEAYDVSSGPARLVRRIETGEGAHAFRAKGDARHVFVSNRVANTISLIDTRTLSVVSQMPGPGGPDCMDLLSDGRTLLLSSRWARKMTVIDTERRVVVRQVRVGRSPHGVWTLDHAARQ